MDVAILATRVAAAKQIICVALVAPSIRLFPYVQEHGPWFLNNYLLRTLDDIRPIFLL